MTIPRKSGLYALIRTDGGPVSRADRAALGLAAGEPDKAAIVEAIDPCDAARDHHLLPDGTLQVLAGDLWDLAEAARSLGLPPGSSPARIIGACFDRHGSEAVWRLRGEWTWLRRDRDGSVVVLASLVRRDPVLYAAGPAQLALAPDLAALAALDWVDDTIDAEGLCFAVGKGDLRRARGARTILREVRELPPGAMLTYRGAGTLRIEQPALPAAPAFQGDFGDAVAAARAHLQVDLNQRIARYPATAILLSGGLDSSLLAWLVSTCGADVSQVRCFTSSAPPGSGLADESDWAERVARHLGLELHRIVPDPALDAYRPADRILAGANGPPLANRHVLTESFQRAARDYGCTRMLNGTYGELGLTAHLAGRSRPGWLAALGAWRKAWQERLGAPRAGSAGSPFHVRLAPCRAAVPILTVSATMPPPGPLFGLLRGADKAWSLANEFYAGAARMDYPFRDAGLLQLLAGMPRQLPAGPDGDRAIARAMLQGGLPDAVRLRRQGLPASPDHLLRLQRQADTARSRIALFRAAGLADWLDLDWLDQALDHMAQRGTRSHLVANEVQLTAIAAEYLLWWQDRRPCPPAATAS